MDRSILTTFLLPAGLILASAPAHAQFWQRLTNPDVIVTLTHPPGLGIKVKRVAFAPVQGNDAEELVAVCIEGLSSSGEIEVLDRGTIEKVIKEQAFGQSGVVDQASAVKMGNLLGSPVLLIVKVFYLHVTKTPTAQNSTRYAKDGSAYNVRTYISTTKANFSASIQAIDLATGKTYTQKRISASPALQNASNDGQPEYPDEGQVREMAFKGAWGELRPMLLSWNESQKLIFYDDKDYGMKDAYQRLKINDYSGALAKSIEALGKAKADPNVKPKYIGRTNYNVGMSYFIKGDLREALPFMKAAEETDPSNSIFREGEEKCLKAIMVQSEMARVDEKTARLDLGVPKQVESPVFQPTENEPKAGAQDGRSKEGASSVEERIKHLNDLRKKGLITPQEYQKKKAEIMKDL